MGSPLGAKNKPVEATANLFIDVAYSDTSLNVLIQEVPDLWGAQHTAFPPKVFICTVLCICFACGSFFPSPPQ